MAISPCCNPTQNSSHLSSRQNWQTLGRRRLPIWKFELLTFFCLLCYVKIAGQLCNNILCENCWSTLKQYAMWNILVNFVTILQLIWFKMKIGCLNAPQLNFVLWLLYFIYNKGQLISKGLFGVSYSSKKWPKIFFSRLGRNLKFSSLHFGRVEYIKRFFKIN